MRVLAKAKVALRAILAPSAILLASLTTQSWADPAQVYKERSDAVVLIIARNEGSGSNSKGTGFVVAPGYVLTNAHVVQDSNDRNFERIAIFLRSDNMNDGNLDRLTNGKLGAIVAANSELDLALIEVDGLDNVEAIPFSDSANVDIGSQVLAIGHPENGGLWSLTTGRIGSSIKNHEGITGKHVLQTETPLNRGNSGGPLLNWDGELIGVNSSIARSGAGGLAITGVNFAIESNVASDWLSRHSLAVVDADSQEPASALAVTGGDDSEQDQEPEPTNLAATDGDSRAPSSNDSQNSGEQGAGAAPFQQSNARPEPVVTPAPLLAQPRSDGLLSRPRPFKDYALFRAFAEQQQREFQGFASDQQDAFKKFMEKKSK